MRTAPTAACEVHADIEPLGLRREKATIELYEKCKRELKGSPNRSLVDGWQPGTRLRQKSMLHKVLELKDKHDLPTLRKETIPVCRDMPPHINVTIPDIRMTLLGDCTKKDDPVTLLNASLRTIDSYPDDWIHVYTDGSATRGAGKAGYGIYMEYSDGSFSEHYKACGKNSSNYDAEVEAIGTALELLKMQMMPMKQVKHNIVIFTDAISALQSLGEDPLSKLELKSIILDAHDLMETYGVKIILQWIPGHSDTPGNDKADKLAKKGSDKTQPHTKATYRTAKQIIRANIKEEWLRGWATNETGRELFRHMAAPKRADPINDLSRKDQSTIFRLRVQHIGLNKHLYRIGATLTSACPLCDCLEETVEHHLFHWQT